MDFLILFFSQTGYFAAVLIFLTVFFNGATDASNAVATCVGTKCLTVTHATVLSAVFNFFGVFTMGYFSDGVAHTMRELASFPSTDAARCALCASMLVVIFWSGIAWLFGIPTSESHAITASLTGAALAFGDIACINTSQYSKVLWGLVLSTAVGTAAGVLASCAVHKFLKNRTDDFFKNAQIIGACCTSFAHGAQDGLKFLGLFLLFSDEKAIFNTSVILAVSLVMFAGTAVGGKKIIRSVGEDMVKIDKIDGFASDIASSACLIAAGICGGIPMSTTHTKTSAILGAGLLNTSSISLKTVRGIVSAWLLTFPVCTVLGYIITKIMT